MKVENMGEKARESYVAHAFNWKPVDRGYKAIPAMQLRGRYAQLRDARTPCPHCGAEWQDTYRLSHIKPLWEGGDHVLSNVTVICRFCAGGRAQAGSEGFSAWLGGLRERLGT